MAGYAQLNEATPLEARWTWLMAAHVVGQPVAALHVDSHRRMLRLAVRTRDWPEAAGQVFRLALVPLGHALGRLPAGNVGRATVNAFRPMQPGPAVRALIAWADAGEGERGATPDPGRPAAS